MNLILTFFFDATRIGCSILALLVFFKESAAQFMR